MLAVLFDGEVDVSSPNFTFLQSAEARERLCPSPPEQSRRGMDPHICGHIIGCIVATPTFWGFVSPIFCRVGSSDLRNHSMAVTKLSKLFGAV